MTQYRLRIIMDVAESQGVWQRCHEGGCEADRLNSVIKTLEATAQQLASGELALAVRGPADAPQIHATHAASSPTHRKDNDGADLDRITSA